MSKAQSAECKAQMVKRYALSALLNANIIKE
jgi:hypothetical protein